ASNGARPKTRTRNGKHDTHPPTVAEALDRRTLLAALRAFKRGDFDVRLPDNLEGVDGQICAAFNDIAQTAAQLGADASELATAVVEEGRTKRRLRTNGVRGGWSTLVDTQNTVLDGLTNHMSEISRVVTAVAEGNLRERMDEEGADLPVRGQFLRDARTVNNMVAQLGQLNSELTRVAMEVGVEGRLGAQGRVSGVG